MGDWAGPGFVVHVAILHVGVDEAADGGQLQVSGGDGVVGGVVDPAVAALDVEGVESEEEVGGDDVGGDVGL